MKISGKLVLIPVFIPIFFIFIRMYSIWSFELTIVTLSHEKHTGLEVKREYIWPLSWINNDKSALQRNHAIKGGIREVWSSCKALGYCLRPARIPFCFLMTITALNRYWWPACNSLIFSHKYAFGKINRFVVNIPFSPSPLLLT